MSLTVIKDFRAALGPARHQGRRPTCLSFAASDVHQHARQHPDTFCVEWLYYHVSQHAGTGPQSGTTVPDTRAVLKASGQPIERVWPYNPYPPHPSRWSPPATTSKVMTCGSAGCSTGLPGIRQEIDADTPVVIGLYTSITFNDPTSWDYAGSEVILNDDNGLPIDPTRGHAVVVVGRGEYGGEPVVLLRNSWGARWGHQGHAWLRESYLGPRLVDAFVISKGDGNVLQSDGRYADADASPRLVETAKALRDAPAFHLGGVVVHIEQPSVMSDNEVAVVRHVNKFLRKHDQYPISTVANTIFPERLDHGDGVEALTERYLENYGRMPARMRGWGRYFQRFVSWPNTKGEPINQLATIIEMLGGARTGPYFHTDKYELVVSDPARRMRNVRSRNCLSLVELKPEKATNQLHIYATYRNHYYVQKTLGNILGLVDLQAFIAREAGFDVGTLTLHSTSATLETNSVPWGKNDIRTLIDECDGLLITQRAA